MERASDRHARRLDDIATDHARATGDPWEDYEEARRASDRASQEYDDDMEQNRKESSAASAKIGQGIDILRWVGFGVVGIGGTLYVVGRNRA